MKTILITGANGQLGKEIRLFSESPKLAAYDFLFTDIDLLDITSRKCIEEYYAEHRFDLVINCAAYTAVDKAETESALAHLVNCTAVKNLASVCSNLKIKIIHVSTDYVFDGCTSVPYRETDIPNPASVYGLTKYNGELELINSDADSIIIRTSWLYSSFGNNFVKTILRLGKERESLNIVYDQVGCPTYAKDLALTILDIMYKVFSETRNFKGEVYHYSNEGVCSWYDFAIEILRTAGINCTVNPIDTSQYPLPAKRPQYSVFNKSKIKSDFGITIPYWKDSLAMCMQRISVL